MREVVDSGVEYGKPMPVDEPLPLEPVIDLVGDAMLAAMAGLDPKTAAAEIIKRRQPSIREVTAARRENHLVHGGGTPEVLRGLVAPTSIPGDVVRLRRLIDDILSAAERSMGSA